MTWLQSSTGGLLLLCCAAIALLLFLIIKMKLEPFIALFITGISLALAAGLSVERIVGTALNSSESLVDTGFGKVLGHVAILIGLGTVMGAFLERSGGAKLLADKLIGIFGEKGTPIALGLVGYVFGIPLFWDIAVFMLASLVHVVAREGTGNLVRYVLPVLAGISAAHAFLPPHPGPTAMGGMLGVGLGWVIAMGVLCGIPAFAVALVYASWISRRVNVEVPSDFVSAEPTNGGGVATATTVSLATVLVVIVTPLLLILGATFGTITLPPGALLSVLTFIGNPAVALTVATLLAYYLLGIRQGISAQELAEVGAASLRPVGLVLLTIGGGAFFGAVIAATGVGVALTTALAGVGLPVLLMSYVISTAMRLAQGSTTVAIVTAGGIIGPTLAVGFSQPQLALIAIAICAGGIGWSQVNDAGLWIISRMFNMTVKQTLMTWSVMVTVLSLTAFGVAAATWMFV